MFELLKRFFRNRPIKKPLYEYGTFGNGFKDPTPARRNTKTGEVQFVLWKAGQQGHKEDYWHKVGDGWEKTFIKNPNYSE